jgi:hypothetical protein
VSSTTTPFWPAFSSHAVPSTYSATIFAVGQLLVAGEGLAAPVYSSALVHLELAGGAGLFFCCSMAALKPASSTVTPRSRHTSLVRSSGKP